MISIYGDSHARISFQNLILQHNNYSFNSITMFRIGRDNVIVNYDNSHNNKDSVICLVYGEIDCRCHIQRQINTGRDEDDVIKELVNNYFMTIKNNINEYKKIIIVGVIPQIKRGDYENIHGPILHEFPFVGEDEDRCRYTIKINKLIEELCNNGDYVNYIYFNPYYYYTNKDGTLNYELSDKICHLGDNTFFLEKFVELYKNIMDM